ncbi:lipid II flippase MurJ [Metasolibacillus sp. FSL K6-0083]|uniref:murein biosynthesis integral membrane protein MurJ n=1 Tax=Metasolibacillus sp. FSL K6-0083 TaxID=2921416 RepID=UPI000796DB8A|nr:murein biosynthesis protein MurJ [[Bacillus] sp. KCTC 13219]
MNRILKIVGAVAVINILARLFGFLREVIIGWQYGTTELAASIINAYTIPNFLYLVIGGAFTTAFISIYHKTSASLTDYIRRTFTTIIVSISIISLLFIIFANPILHWYFQAATGEEYERLKSLYYWMMPSTIMLVLSTWLSGVLNVQGKFHLSSFSVLIYNLSFLIISVGLSLVIGPIGYGVGALLGAACMFFFLVFGVRKAEHMSFKLMPPNADDQKELWKVALPIMLGGATAQMYILIQRFFTNMLDASAVTAVNYATKMSQFPQAILMTAVTTVIFPLLSKKEGEEDTAAVKALYLRGLRLLYILVMPVSVYFYFQAEPIIRIVFERNQWDATDTAVMTPLLTVFSLTMFFLAANMYVTRFYYAKGNSMTPVIFSFITVFGVNIAVIQLMIGQYAAHAIAWGTVVSAAANFLLLVIWLQWKYKLKLIDKNMSQFMRFATLTVIYIAIAWLVSTYIHINFIWLHVIVTFMILLISYVLLLALFRLQELQQIIAKVKKKLFKK